MWHHHTATERLPDGELGDQRIHIGQQSCPRSLHYSQSMTSDIGSIAKELLLQQTCLSSGATMTP